MRLLSLLVLTISLNAETTSFRVGLANIYFMSALFDNNVKNPIFKETMENPPSAEIEDEFDRLSRQFLERYFKYLNADVLVLCEADHRPEMLAEFSEKHLGGRYEVIHNSPVVKEKKFYTTQQIAAYVDRDRFLIRRYEAMEPSEVTSSNQLYPFPGYKSVSWDGKERKIWWSRYPIEFDLALKSDPNHWYKFIATYPKSKFARDDKDALLARLSNRVQQEMIRARVEAVAGQFEDIFVLGDMNDSYGMDDKEKELQTDSLAVLYKGEQDPILWDPVTYLPNQGTYIYKGVPETIDYIFVSHGLKKGKGTTASKVWEHDQLFRAFLRDQHHANPDRLQSRELFISDHGPVTIDVTH